jgi:hypothetical protein
VHIYLQSLQGLSPGDALDPSFSLSFPINSCLCPPVLISFAPSQMLLADDDTFYFPPPLENACFEHSSLALLASLRPSVPQASRGRPNKFEQAARFEQIAVPVLSTIRLQSLNPLV